MKNAPWYLLHKADEESHKAVNFILAPEHNLFRMYLNELFVCF